VIEAGGDYHAGVIFMKNEAVHATSNMGVIVRSKIEGTGFPVSQKFA
jgi:hypothetical protein